MSKQTFRTGAERISSLGRRVIFPLAIVLGGWTLSGCTAEVEPVVPAAGVVYYDYPYTYYDDHVVYFIDGTWYYPYGNRWYAYRHVPPELARQRGALHYPPRYGHGGGPAIHPRPAPAPGSRPAPGPGGHPTPMPHPAHPR